jgi:biopolymer transport protein ExbD
MKLTRTRKAKKGRIEIIPMIDVMFFLLATFILASLSMQRFEGLGVNLVQGKAEKISVEQQITFTITHDNSIFLNKEEIKLGDVKTRLAEILNDPEKIIIIASDKDAKQGVVMQVMLQAKAAGAQHFSMIAKS